MEIGTIVKINDDLKYGFAEVPKIGKIYFAKNTEFLSLDFDNLEVGQKVTLDIVDTERGLFAKSLNVKDSKIAKKQSNIEQSSASL